MILITNYFLCVPCFVVSVLHHNLSSVKLMI